MTGTLPSSAADRQISASDIPQYGSNILLYERQ
jgi:hypothetical protein